MPDVDTMASWAFVAVCVFVGWVALGIALAIVWGLWRDRQQRHADRYERRWREDDGNDP